MFAGFLERGRALRGLLADAPLAGELVESLLGRELETSVSKLEDFAACPFKFFVGRTLRGEERKEFEVDARLSGDGLCEEEPGCNVVDPEFWREVAR